GTEPQERSGGAAALGDVQCLDEAGAGVDHRGLDVGDVRRGLDPGQTGLTGRLGVVAAHGDDLEVHAAVEELAVEQLGQLAHGQPVQIGRASCKERVPRAVAAAVIN